MKLVERMPRVCNAVIKANGGYFEESQIYLDLFNTVGYYMIPCVLFHKMRIYQIAPNLHIFIKYFVFLSIQKNIIFVSTINWSKLIVI